mmetsp:Transcript_1758/g.7083  ORF Transcript_1758/g.7083 Transcript_1758/m.7083 type:complete len:212 (-) Transcript_1758:1035-1670(-)
MRPRRLTSATARGGSPSASQTRTARRTQKWWCSRTPASASGRGTRSKSEAPKPPVYDAGGRSPARRGSGFAGDTPPWSRPSAAKRTESPGASPAGTCLISNSRSSRSRSSRLNRRARRRGGPAARARGWRPRNLTCRRFPSRSSPAPRRRRTATASPPPSAVRAPPSTRPRCRRRPRSSPSPTRAGTCSWTPGPRACRFRRWCTRSRSASS